MILSGAFYLPKKNIMVGTTHYDSSGVVVDNDDYLIGSNNDDIINGLGGNDQIWGGLGNDDIYGGVGNDVIRAQANGVNSYANWGFDKAWGGLGNDTLDFSYNNNAVELHGDQGIDLIAGGRGNDRLYGGSGDDTILGGDGDDIIDGGTSGWYDPTEHKGANTYDIDNLYGGAGRDTFVFNFGEHATIYDWNGAEDRIGLKLADSGNRTYVEIYLAPTFDYLNKHYVDASATRAREWADSHVGGDYANNFAFVTNGKDAWLFGDLDHNGHVDTAITLVGVTSISQFSMGNFTDVI